MTFTAYFASNVIIIIIIAADAPLKYELNTVMILHELVAYSFTRSV